MSDDDTRAPETTEAEVEASVEPKKKKRKKPAAEAAPIDASLPDDGRVREMDASFQVGDFARTRTIANELVATNEPGLVDAGRDYLARTGVDPIQMAFLAACLAALVTIAFIYI